MEVIAVIIVLLLLIGGALTYFLGAIGVIISIAIAFALFKWMDNDRRWFI